MNNYQKFGLIAGQILIGLGFGLVGAIVTALLIILYFELIGMHLDLFPEIMSAVIGGYVGMQTGIGFDGYKFLKRNRRQTDFIKYFLQSVLGLIMGLLGFYLLITSIGNRMPHGLTNFLAVALPLSGAIIGFDFGLTPKKKDLEKIDG